MFSPSIATGNKNFIVTGTVNIFGNPRSGSSRLLQSAYPEDEYIMVNKGLDWRKGDILALAPTNIDVRSYETLTVKNYTAETGQVFFETNVTKYHYGNRDSTGDRYSGVDMRGEVTLLTRDVMITADYGENSTTLAHPDPWPCRVLVADFFEPWDLVYRKGTIHWDNMAIYNCSQTDTENSALKFDMAIGGQKIITNSAISNGKAYGIDIKSSQQITIKDTTIYNFITYGLWTDGGGHITLENNIMIGITPQIADHHPDLEWPLPCGGFDIAYAGGGMTLRNNTVSGVWHSGFRVYSHTCGDEDLAITDNVAHSVSGFGVIVLNGGGSCSEFSRFYGYKNHLATVHFGSAGHARVKDVVSIDSKYGITVIPGSFADV